MSSDEENFPAGKDLVRGLEKAIARTVDSDDDQAFDDEGNEDPPPPTVLQVE